MISSKQADKQYIVKGSLINSLGLITNSISPALVIMLARFFPQNEFGLFISLQLLVLTASRFFVLGLDKGVMWFIPKNQQQQRPIAYGLFASLNITLLFSLAGFIILTGLIFLGALSFIPELSQLPKSSIILCLFNIIPYMVLNIGATAFEGIRKPQYKILINRFVVNSLFPVFAIVSYYLNFGMFSLSVGFTAASVIGTGWYIWVLQKHFGRWQFSLALPKELWVYSFPLTFADLIGSMLLRVDIWMVLGILGPEESAVYAIMVVLSNGVKTIRQNFDSLVVPVVSKMNRATLDLELKPVFSYTINLITSIQLLIALAILFFPQEILSIAGKDYVHAPIALSILLIGNLTNGFLGGNSLILLGIGKSTLLLIINTATLMVNIACNAYLIPKMGIAGAALGTVIAFIFQNFLFLISVYGITGKHFYEKHLIVNLGFITGLCFVVYNYFNRIQSLPLATRVQISAVAVLCAFLIFFLKRKSFKLK
jgi:O-antigen/teichoic acid export membrane protein